VKNPWLAANPFLSMWLSAANAMFGAARGHALTAARRQQAVTTNAVTRAMIEFWSSPVASPKQGKTRRAKSR